MKIAYIKENLRKIRKTKSRFISLMLIVMLGVLFFSGMNSVSPDMENTLNQYLKNNNVSDIQIISALGFSQDDVEELRKLNNVVEVNPGFLYDVILDHDGKRLPVRLNSIEKEQDVNKMQIIEGRNIENDKECLVDERLSTIYSYTVGDKLIFQSGTEDDINEEITNTEYTIVGKARTPAYISKFYGSTNLENGELMGCVYVLKDVFKSDIYSNIYVKTNISNDILKTSDDYKKELEPIVKQVEKLGETRAKIRYEEIYKENVEKLQEAKDKLNDARNELQEAKDALYDARNKLNDLAKQIYDGSVTLSQTITSTDEIFKNYDEKLNTAKAEIETNTAELNDAEKQIEEGKQTLENAKKEYQESEQQLQQLDNQINQILYTLAGMDKTSGEYAVLKRKLTYLENVYSKGAEKLAEAKEQIAKSEQELNSKIKELEETKQKLNIAQEQIEANDNELKIQKTSYLVQINASKNSLNYYQEILRKGNLEYFDKQKEYQKESEKAMKKIEKKEQEVKDAEETLEKLDGKWHVIGLYDNQGFVAFKNDLEKIGIMGKVFPVIFFVVAALVSITTIARMIEEDRMTIATEKALGYNKMYIVAKYVLYSLLSSTLGLIFGTLIGSYVITNVLFSAYRSLYSIPDLLMNVNITCLAIATIITFTSTVVCAIIVTIKEVKGSTAELMRPKAPREGKQVFLEKVPGFWERLSFLFKISIRNIFRYKRRLFMTIIGIAGCTALVYTGISLKNSIDEIGGKQFGDIKFYNMQINLKYDMTDEEVAKVVENTRKIEEITEANAVRERSTDIVANGVNKSIFYMVGESDALPKYIKLQNRKNKEKIDLTDAGIIITEKLSEELKVKVGDTVTLKSGEKEGKAQIIGITENYLYNYIYMTPTVYQEVYHEQVQYNEILANTLEINNEKENELAQEIKEDSKISGIVLMRVINDEYKSSLGGLSSIVFLCVGCASLLAFIVLFNLNTINIEERKRELATIKVLGFYNKEVSSYVFRENIILSIIGGIVGLFLGMLILGPIMKSAEVETIYLPITLNFLTFVLSFALTMVFTIVTDKLMNRRLRKIDMIESLKSVE